jgi:hypothetical protein
MPHPILSAPFSNALARTRGKLSRIKEVLFPDPTPAALDAESQVVVVPNT